jgi:2-polyprenyl-3-methyl-5-hydroxy-6-metoxy-1,4-benzoquinol methylase
MEIKEFHERYWELIKFRNDFNPSRIVLQSWDDEKTVTQTDTFKILKYCLEEYSTPKILDVGAGSRKLKRTIEIMGLKYFYKSLDISKGVQHDYIDIKAINEKFDIVTMLELIEHLALDLSLQYMSKAFEILNKNGSLIISTPNINHINQLWKQDITHIQQYPAKDIYSILRMIGFSGVIKVYRINLRSPKMNLKKFILEQTRIVLNKILGTDYAHGILIVAKKT